MRRSGRSSRTIWPSSRTSVSPIRRLSGRIGELTGTEAFLLVRVDYWNYTTENDKKIAKVSLSITMIEAKTGKILWTAVHHRISDYLIIKPDLPDVARDLIREMIGYMPH